MGKPAPGGDQKKRLEEQQRKADEETAKIEAENKRKSDERARRALGRSSLITTSELGVTENLG